MNNQESDKQIIIEDLPVDEARKDEVKGGSTGTRNTGALRNVSNVNM